MSYERIHALEHDPSRPFGAQWPVPSTFDLRGHVAYLTVYGGTSGNEPKTGPTPPPGESHPVVIARLASNAPANARVSIGRDGRPSLAPEHRDTGALAIVPGTRDCDPIVVRAACILDPGQWGRMAFYDLRIGPLVRITGTIAFVNSETQSPGVAGQ